MADVTSTVVTTMTIDASQPEKVLKDVEKAQKKVGEQTKKTKKETTDYSGALKGMTGRLSGMVGPLGGVVTGLGNMTTGLKGARAALIALPILALVAALTALFTWFNRTAEGQEKLATITAAFGASLDVLLDIVADVGEALFNAFQDPKQAIQDLLKFLKDNLINRFKALGLIAVAVGRAIKGIFDTSISVTEELKNMASAAVQFATGLDSKQQNFLLEKTNEAVRKIRINVEKATLIQKRANILRRENLQLSLDAAEAQARVTELFIEATDRQLTFNQRAEAAKEAQREIAEIYERQRVAKQVEIDLLERQQALGHNTIEDNEKLVALKIEQVNLTTQENQALRTVINARQQLEEARNAEEKTLDEIFIAREERNANEIKNFEKRAERLKEIERDRLLFLQEGEQLSATQREIIREQSNDRILAIDKELKDNQKQLFDDSVKNIAELSEKLSLFNKATAIFNVIVSTARSIAASAEAGFPAAFITIPLAVASGAAQIAAINSAQRPNFAVGGLLSGARHSAGGIPAELEDGEAVINRVSMADPVLRQMASDINQAGGGIAFAQQGLLAGQANLNSSLESFGSDVEKSLRSNRNVLVTEDLESVQGRVIVTEDVATL